MRILKHPILPLWCREDGAICMPPCRKYPKFRWTFGCPDKRGYLYIKFRGKHYFSHRLIAETFLDNPLNLYSVDHYPDRNPSNNAVSNLRWADRKMQQANRQIVEDSLVMYGVRKCEDRKAYSAAYRAEHREEERTRVADWKATQKALGRHERKCPDGKRHWLTDSEFSAMFG